jgi:ADP-ribose pyrophosphatase YjhB (NUDIX family)
MRKAARAIIIEGSKVLLMQRDKDGHRYFTLVGGSINDKETVEQALQREVKEETGLDVTKARLVYFEEHPEPHNEQYIFLCEVAPHEEVALQTTSEEAFMNKVDINIHTPVWIEKESFSRVPFRTIQLQEALNEALKKGFPDKPVKL